jgi:UDP-N-acetylmuramate--alanine ligase
MAVLCIDDRTCENPAAITKPITTYGFDEAAQVRAVNSRFEHGRMHFTVKREGMADLDVVLNHPGMHNVLNSLAAIAVATEVDASDAAIVKALAEFHGVGRRFQSYGEQPAKDGGHYTLIDDYGHHPVEMAATIAAARGAFPGRRLVLVFQPHRYTRTRDCFEDFAKVLSETDVLVLTEVYPAGEAPIVAADGRALARAVRVAGKVEPLFVENVADVPASVRDLAQAGDVVLVMGAGSIGQVAPTLGSNHAA